MKVTKREMTGTGIGMIRLLWVLALWIVPLTAWAQTTRTWTGNGADALASTAENWSGGIAPDSGDHIRFDDSHLGNLWTNAIWELDIEPASWTQTVAYAGTVTIETRYPDSWREKWGYSPLGESFTNLVITGDCLLESGTWTHTYNPDVNDDRNRLAVTVGGTFTLADTAGIDVSGRGFWGTRGPGGGNDTSHAHLTIGASHGGQGGHGEDADGPSRTYGSFAAPLRLGSGGGRHSGGSRGGGAVDIRISGAATLNGNILANGIVGHSWRPAGAGGSIFFTAQSLTGDGRLEAWGASARTGGGGGRVAVHLAATDDFDALEFDARGGNGSGGVYNRSAAGTIYLQGVDNGTTNALLRVDNQGLETEPAWVYTPLPAEIVAESVVLNEEGEFAALIITNSAQAKLAHTLRMRDLTWIADDARLDLPYGLALLLDADRPSGFPDLSTPTTDPVQVPVSHGEGWIYPDNGMIIWGDQSYELPFFAWGGSNGTIDNYDSEAVYAFQSNLTITAMPNAGYDFIRWIGSLPEEADPSDPELSLTIIPDLHFMAVMAASSGTRTWIGTNANELASNSQNWYPEGAPQNGEHIVLNEASFSQTTWDTGITDPLERWQAWIHHSVDVTWDHDITAASWTQTEHYTGTVTFETRYPDNLREQWGYAPLGETFTNLVITGDCLMEAGTWTHPDNPDVEDDRNRLAVRVGGSFTLAENAVIDVSGQGFRELRGPGGATDTSNAEITRGASHGGHGGHGVDAPDAPSPTYGCFVAPYRLGSGGGKHSGHYGGGAVDLNVTGAATIHGNVLANGVKGHDWRAGPAGGSIFLRAASLAGSGRMEAWGVSSRTGGGGGRIAVHLSAANDFDAVTFDASGGNGSGGENNRAAAGTIYLQGIENGMTTAELRIDNQGLETVPGWVFTPIPSDVETPESPAILETTRTTTLVVDQNAQTSLNMDIRMLDLFLRTENDAWLYLQGHTLYLRSPYHDDWGHEDWVVYDGGEIVWTPRGTMIIFR